jgi:cellulose synthase/poly-beta-1,6-N-acetylglucosamine synthase-like glycosyltransferase
MLIIIITHLFCVAQNLVPEASAFFVGMETNAAILALIIFALIVFRVWFVAPLESPRPASQ